MRCLRTPATSIRVTRLQEVSNAGNLVATNQRREAGKGVTASILTYIGCDHVRQRENARRKHRRLVALSDGSPVYQPAGILGGER